VLTFNAAGSDGSDPPAARRYLVKQSLRPIRSARDFDRAAALCRGACSFDDDIEVGSLLRLKVDYLRNDRYYYAVAARDNVSGRIGPRSRTVSVRSR
jgi:hypothetical protein